MITIHKIETSDKIRQVNFYQFYQLYRKNKLSVDIDESAINEKYPGFLDDFNFQDVDLDTLTEFITIERRFEIEQFSCLFSMKTDLFCFFDGNIDELLNIKDIKEFPLLFDEYELSPFNDLVSIEYYDSAFLFNIQGEDMNLSASPNLYDGGYCRIVFLDKENFVIEYYDENNGTNSKIYNYINGCLSKDIEISSLELLEKLYEQGVKWAMWNLSDSLLRNRDAVLLSIKSHPYNILDNLEGQLLNDREIVFGAVIWDGCALQYASEELKNDREIVLAAIKNNYRAYQYCSEPLFNDKEFIIEAYSHKNEFNPFIERDKFRQDLNDNQTKQNENDDDLPF